MRSLGRSWGRWAMGALVSAVTLMSGAGWAAPVLGYRVVARLPHDAGSFTEGFLYRDGLFYEGSGLEGRSALTVSVPESGKVVRRVEVPPPYFGEGIVDWGPYLYEWTWTSHVGFVYDRRTLKRVKQFTYEGEGWGMTRTAREIVTSDGSSTLTFRGPATFRPVRTVAVHDGPILIDQVNELEFIRNEIWANVWHSERLLRISPADGQVLAYVDLHGLRPLETMANPEAVLNGIAYDAARHRIFVTGKQWPAVFQIEVTGEPKSK